MNPLFPLLWVNLNYYCTFAGIALALTYPQSSICHLARKTSPNQRTLQLPEERTNGFMPFRRELARNETRKADDNRWNSILFRF